MKSQTKRTIRKTAQAVAILFAGLAVGATATIDWMPAGSSDHWGNPVEIDEAPVTSPMKFDVKIGCQIGAFGVYPWLAQGAKHDDNWNIATRWALARQGIPDEIIPLAIAKLKGDGSELSIRMGDKYGVSGAEVKRYFKPYFNTTYRNGDRWTVCLASQTNFHRTDRQEQANAWEITYKGTRYVFGFFGACNNVTRFFAMPEGWTPEVLPPASKGPAFVMPHPTPQQPAPKGFWQYEPDAPLQGYIAPPPPFPEPNKVPEPSTWWLLLIALLIFICIARRK